MILNGQKNTLAEHMILSVADNRPPMLDKPLYDFWKSIMELYMQNKEHGRMILESVEHGPLDWPSIEVDGVTRLKKVMSSPNHPTSDIKDAFSSNFPDYTSASPDYSPASLGKIMAPKRTSTSAAPTMNQATIRQLIDDRVVAALEAQAANMENTDYTNRNPKPRETLFEQTELVYSCSNCTEDCKMKFAAGTLTEDTLSWWNCYAKPIGIEQADKIAWSELKRLLTDKYCP
uniref:Reverse transcriptase domain-containing protein n=1 Tax=Tanacetum cinerariifolium TaxID=118510 RepID=A0A6L2NU18_TANCI|nr:reverse transcriptase domain-containing protein [Tanacetum cinerariifolium]